jgi:Chlorophyll A-B binding protein
VTLSARFLQEAELKHGRICMLAALGMLVQEQFTFGGAYFPKMLPIDAHNFYIQTGGMAQIIAAIFFIEAISCYALRETMAGNRAPGDFSFDPLGLGKDGTTFKKLQVNEIKNGLFLLVEWFLASSHITRDILASCVHLSFSSAHLRSHLPPNGFRTATTNLTNR